MVPGKCTVRLASTVQPHAYTFGEGKRNPGLCLRTEEKPLSWEPSRTVWLPDTLHSATAIPAPSSQRSSWGRPALLPCTSAADYQS